MSGPSLLILLAACSAGCASFQELDQTAYAGTFPSSPGRTYYLRRSPFGTTILVCDAGPRDAVCFEKPNGS